MKKKLISIGLMCISIPLISSETLVGVLMSQDTDSVMIDNRKFKGDGIISLVIAPKFSNSNFGRYLSVGGTFGRSDNEREKDEKNKKFTNDMLYRVANLGLTYSPISNITFLGGVGYGQSEGKYYYNIRYDDRNRIMFYTSRTKKDRGVNYNAGLNFSYKDWGIITMYDSYPKVFSVGISWKFGTRARVSSINRVPQKKREVYRKNNYQTATKKQYKNTNSLSQKEAKYKAVAACASIIGGCEIASSLIKGAFKEHGLAQGCAYIEAKMQGKDYGLEDFVKTSLLTAIDRRASALRNEKNQSLQLWGWGLGIGMAVYKVNAFNECIETMEYKYLRGY